MHMDVFVHVARHSCELFGAWPFALHILMNFIPSHQIITPISRQFQL